MKIAITAQDDKLDSLIDQRFGRCKYFLVIDTDKEALIEAVKNKGAIQGHGAGIKAAQQIGELGVKAVISGDIGPNAQEVLKQLEITAYHASGTIINAVGKFKNNELKAIAETTEQKITAAPDDNKTLEKTERIFFPLLNNKGIDSSISPHFGHAPYFGLYNTKTGEFTITDNTLSHTDPSKSPVDQIVEAVNPTTVFAHGIGSRAIMLFNEKGISIKTGSYEKVKDAIQNLKNLKDQDSDCGHGHH